MSTDWVGMLVILHFRELGVWVFLCDLLLAWKSLGVMSCGVDIRNGAEKAELLALHLTPNLEDQGAV